ncbi:MAG: hypothetical protein KJ737_01135 [Proteobacteria bacterium]|nr:hypothetical protein [Pseudomonadota bacterium]
MQYGHFLKIICVLLVVSGIHANASEIDSFTGPCESLPDLTSHLNEKVTEGLRQACINANRKSRMVYFRHSYPFRGEEGVDYCNSDLLYSEIRGQFARAIEGQLETYINELPKELAKSVDFDHSIYRDFTVEETPTLAGLKKMGTVIRMHDNMVGADKFGHFFSEGWSYFIRAYEKGENIDAALFFGEMTESIYFGALTTGVFSYSDLTANFNGMRFWNHILATHPDPLFPDQSIMPYVRCENSKWSVVNDFDWNDYIDPAWDERLNYSLFRNKILLHKVESRIAYMEDTDTSHCSCEDNERETANQMMRKKYGAYGTTLLNLDGHQILSEELSPANLVNRFFGLRAKRSQARREKAIMDFLWEYQKKLHAPQENR